jgi:hypothetical protein
MTEPTDLIPSYNNINQTNNSKPIKQLLDIKLKPEKNPDKVAVANQNLPAQHDGGPVNFKRTQKAKPPKNNINSICWDNGRIELPNTIDEIIGDMVFQEPPDFKEAPSNPLPKNSLEQQQEQILKQQKELLDQLQLGIRPGWFIQCVGRCADGKQCTRNIKKGSEFCMGHAKKLAYGRITTSNALSTNSTDNTNINIPSVARIVMKPKPEWKPKKTRTTSINNIDDGIDSSSGSEDDEPTIPDDIKELIEEPSGTIINVDSGSANSSKSINEKQGKLAKHLSKNKKGPETIGDGNIQPRADVANGLAAETASDAPKQPKKRGRRRKLPIDPRFGNNDYIIMWPIICEDQRFLTDRYENIYSNNPEHPVFIGIREVGGRINRTAMPNFG